MKFYVAGASRQIERAERAMAALRAMGHDITEDWCAAIRAERARGVEDHELTQEQAAEYADRCIEGVKAADVLWVLLSDFGAGMWVELGAGIVTDRAILVSGTATKGHVFRAKAHASFATDDEVLEYVRANFPPREVQS